MNESIGELQVPYQISNAFEQVEHFITHQVRVLNTTIASEVGPRMKSMYWNSRRKDDLLIAACPLIANEITSHRSIFCCVGWPWVLPDPQVLAIRAHKRIERELFDLYFRENPIPGLDKDLCKRIQINYDDPTSFEDGGPTSTGAAPADDDGDPEAGLAPVG